MSDKSGRDELTLVQQPPNINAEMPIGTRVSIIDKDSEHNDLFAGQCDQLESVIRVQTMPNEG